MFQNDNRSEYLWHIPRLMGTDDPSNILPPRVTENYITSTPRPRYRPLPSFGVPIPGYQTMRDNMVHDSVNYQLPQVQMTTPTQPPARSFLNNYMSSVDGIPRTAPPRTYFKRTHGTGDGTLAGIITPRTPVFRPPYMDQTEIENVVLRHRPRYSGARRSLTGNERAAASVNNLNPLHTPFSRSLRPTDVTEPAEMYAAVKNQLNHIDRRRRSLNGERALKEGWVSEQPDLSIQQKLYEQLEQEYNQNLFNDAPLSSRRSDGSEYSYTELSPRHDNQVSLDQSYPEQRSFTGPVYYTPPWSQYDHR